MFKYFYFVVFEYPNENGYIKGITEVIRNNKIKEFRHIIDIQEDIKSFQNTDKSVMVTDFKLLKKKLWFLR